MLAAYTELKNAEKVKRFLTAKNIINTDYLAIKELDHIFFPVTKKISVPRAKIVNVKIQFKKKSRSITIDELLKGILTKKELSFLPRSQEIVGKIMILEVPKELKKKEKQIAKAYLQLNKNIETVVKKNEIHTGEYRTRTVKIIAGKKNKETIHIENGIKVRLHLEKTYFSARSANERLRIAQQVKDGEEVLVMFSGAAPYPLVIARNSGAGHVYGIEINPLAHQYALENVRLNRMENKITIYNGDVKKIVPKMRKKFDRIVMPLPKTGEEFLNLALPKVRPSGIIHLYAFLNEKEIEKYAKKIKKLCETMKHNVKILRKVKCGQFSPGTFRVCIDIKLLK